MGVLSLVGGFLSVVYSVYLFNRVCFGSPSGTLLFGRDLTRLEFLVVSPLILLNLFLGLFP